jgi:hypothetical protein
MYWQTYVERHPVRILTAAALVGLVVGRRAARVFTVNGYRGPVRAWKAGAGGVDAIAMIPARLDSPGVDRLAAASASWQKLDSRVEELVNRVIDDVADAVERVLVPALVGGVQTFLKTRGARAAYRATPREKGD